uniref:Uncharacterized protein n=1 Tax=Candidatus Kentrum sp. FW TaxID=2126338 RepID=A0A450U3X2_9GAMM|nr:MAG: hypothetical protein BECKFW1821C_GA0114237_11488 [Candidatus Kentron sp. FW]
MKNFKTNLEAGDILPNIQFHPTATVATAPFASGELRRTPNHTTYASLSPTDIKATQPAPANPKIKKIHNEIHRAYLRVYFLYPEVQSVYHEV